MFLLSIWSTRKVDFVLALPRSYTGFDMYMELPQGIETKEGISRVHILSLLKNNYVQKEVYRVCNQHITKRLVDIRFKQSRIDKSFF